MKTTKPFNRADQICHRFTQGKAEHGDSIKLLRLKLHGIIPNHYVVNGVDVEPKNIPKDTKSNHQDK